MVVVVLVKKKKEKKIGSKHSMVQFSDIYHLYNNDAISIIIES